MVKTTKINIEKKISKKLKRESKKVWKTICEIKREIINSK